MSEWFPALVSEIGMLWRSTIRFGAVTESMKDLADEETLVRHEVDLPAEKLVREALARKKGYDAHIALARKTPAQVWGILEYDDYIHVALVSVYTVFQGHHLVINMAQDKHTLAHLCVLALKTLRKSGLTPQGFRTKPTIVSAGLAEVRLKDAGSVYEPELVSGYFLAGFTSPDLDERNLQYLLKDIHSL